ncbi:GNAT family N-acetyltransferase [Actinoplanes sp. NPDC051343]|uniref:GNAT family N-acetyltransferase n=1 Tax=Actinoplanes sp. NPDC051343 TaxID=3363906 RepID=UPI0037A192CB
MITVADCQRVQTAWFRYRATGLGGAIWEDGPLTWTDGPDGLNLMFPPALTDATLLRGLIRAGDRPIGAWLNLDVDPAPLLRAGFERGWSPWWMAADLTGFSTDDPRVRLQTSSTDYEGEHAAYADQLAITRLRPQRAWYAAAYDRGHFAGRAWSFVGNDGLAGIFDMAVWPPFRRRGLGTALLKAVSVASGAHRAVLNATPEGKLLYETCGFRPVGEGITYWRHR